MGVRRCLDCLGLSLHPLKNFELVSSVTLTRLHKSAGSPEPSLITFVISTSPYDFIMLGSSDQKEHTCALRRSSSCRTHACVRSLDLKVALNKLCNVLENIDGKDVHARVIMYMYLIFEATKACKFASVRRLLNLERLSGNKRLACINADGCTERRRWYVCKLACSTR